MGMVPVGKAVSRAVVVAVLILPMAAALQNSATDQRYLKEALRKRHEVTLTFTVDVTADGKGGELPGHRFDRLAGTGQSDLPQRMKWAGFKPATDAQRKPTRGTFPGSFQWVIAH